MKAWLLRIGGRLLGRLGSWWATSTASTVLIALAIAGAGAFWLWVSKLQNEVHQCRLDVALQQYLIDSSDTLVGIIDEEKREIVRELEASDHPCLGLLLDDVLRGPEDAAGDEVRDPEAAVPDG